MLTDSAYSSKQVIEVCLSNTTGSSVQVLNIQKICYYHIQLNCYMDCGVPWVTLQKI
jgi:hypothetical protein